jgi:hypothetical protein
MAISCTRSVRGLYSVFYTFTHPSFFINCIAEVLFQILCLPLSSSEFVVLSELQTQSYIWTFSHSLLIPFLGFSSLFLYILVLIEFPIQ